MEITLERMLSWVGKLDDSPGEDTARERFRQLLREDIREVGQIRDYVEECLRLKGDQYNRALQDLVNRVGEFLGFEVVFGRYSGAVGHPGFDGRWASPTGFHIVIEVKTTEVYSVKTKTLLGYVDELISDKVIPNRDSALGLYVVGRPDPEIRQVEHSIMAQGLMHNLRIISVDSLLSLAEMMGMYEIAHKEILSMLKPSGPMIDPVVDLMAELVAIREAEKEEEEEEEKEPEKVAVEGEVRYWITPTRPDEVQTAEECINTLVGQEGVYAFGERTPGRKKIKPGDWICFYATQNGVVAHARVTTVPEKKHHPKVVHPEKFPFVFGVDSQKLYLDEPVVIDAELRSRLERFEGRDPKRAWSWFVRWTRTVTKHDFELLTRQG